MINKNRICKFCGKESFESSSCSACGYIRKRVMEFEKISPGGNAIEFEYYLKDNVEMRQEIPSLSLLSKIMNEVLRGGSGNPKSNPGIESSKISQEYYGL